MDRQLIKSTDDFCKAIREEIETGKGIVPLLGAGLSATAGIPTRPELMAYLKLCVAMALGLGRFRECQWSPWRPQSGLWPTMQGDWQKNGEQGTDVLKRIVTTMSSMPKEADEKMYRFRELCQEAYGSLADWRLALQFLARLRLAEDSPNPASSSHDGRGNFLAVLKEHAKWAYDAIALSDVDEHVIDSFFNHIVAWKTPSMGHNMVANLVAPLRIRVILSLNFDDLLEQAVRSFGSQLSLFAVHYEAGLPPWSLLGKQVALVKLHGGRYGLRADFSLDKAPTERDRRHFRSYLLGRDLSEDSESASEKSMKASAARYHLLVAGVSGQDIPTRSAIRLRCEFQRDKRHELRLRRELIFRDAADRQRLVEILAEVRAKTACLCVAHAGRAGRFTPTSS